MVVIEAWLLTATCRVSQRVTEAEMLGRWLLLNELLFRGKCTEFKGSLGGLLIRNVNKAFAN